LFVTIIDQETKHLYICFVINNNKMVTDMKPGTVRRSVVITTTQQKWAKDNFFNLSAFLRECLDLKINKK